MTKNAQLGSHEQVESKPKGFMARRKIRTRIGIVLILISGLLWFSLFTIPFLPLEVGQKSMLAGSIFVGVQLAWWSGAALAGPTVAGRITQWFRRSK